jgi:hypothetical protein
MYSFVYNLPNDGLVEAEICSTDTTNHKGLFIIDAAIPRIKYYIYCLLHRTWITLNFRVYMLGVPYEVKKKSFICRPRPSSHQQPIVSN